VAHAVNCNFCMTKMQSVHSTGTLSRQDLELALAIAEEGSVTRAALRLHLSQSALSHQLRSLEDRLGVPLFRRARRQMIASPVGEQFVARARRICGEFRASEEALDTMIHGKTRIIRLGTECYTSFHWLPALVRELARTVDNVELRIVVEATQRAKAALVSGETDAAILQSSGEDRQFLYWPLFRDELMLLVSSRHALARRRFVPPEDVCSETLILHEMPGRRSAALDEFFVPAGTYPSQIRHVQLTEAIIEMVRAQMGVTILARWLAEPYIRNRELSIVRLGTGLWRDWRLATVRGHALLAEIEQISNVLSSLLKTRVWSIPPNEPVSF
jgi:LysR family transcriptional regulator for metE and metH